MATLPDGRKNLVNTMPIGNLVPWFATFRYALNLIAAPARAPDLPTLWRANFARNDYRSMLREETRFFVT